VQWTSIRPNHERSLPQNLSEDWHCHFASARNGIWTSDPRNHLNKRLLCPCASDEDRIAGLVKQSGQRGPAQRWPVFYWNPGSRMEHDERSINAQRTKQFLCRSACVCWAKPG
jgi:hypothetical protein